MSSPSPTKSSNTADGPTIEELLRSFEDYSKKLLAFQKAHPISDDGQSPFVVISDEIALMAARRAVLTRLRRNLDGYRNTVSATSSGGKAPRPPKTPESIAGPSKSGSLPTPPGGCVELEPATGLTSNSHPQIRTTGALTSPVQLPRPVHLPESSPRSLTWPLFRPLEREDAFYGSEMFARYDFVRGRNGASFTGINIPARAASSKAASSLTVVADAGAPASAPDPVLAPAHTAATTTAPPSPPSSEVVVVTRVTRASARGQTVDAAGSGIAPPPKLPANRKGKKRPSDDVNGNSKDEGGRNLPPAKRRKGLPLKKGGAPK